MVTTTGTHMTMAVEESVATLTLNHPPVNALTPDMLAELEAALGALAADDAVKVVVITGAGRFLSPARTSGNCP